MHYLLKSCSLLGIIVTLEASASSDPVGISRQLYGESIAYDMNGNGQVAAVIKEKNGTPHAVLFEKGHVLKLELPGESESEVKHINEHGEVIGFARSGKVQKAFIRNSKLENRFLGSFGGPSSYGVAINNAGLAAGFADTADGNWHAFLYTPGEPLRDLGTLGGKISYAAALNQSGQVAGTATLADGSRHAFRFDEQLGMTDLGTLGGRYSSASALNDHGVVVGASEMKDRRWHAFIHDGKQMSDLGKLIGFGDSFATGVNNQGHVVGVVDTADLRYTFVWRNNKLTLHPAGKSLYLTNAINNSGRLIGASYDHGLNAATMPSNAVPFVDMGGNKILGFNLFALAVAGLAAIYRKRIKGLFFGGQLRI